MDWQLSAEEKYDCLKAIQSYKQLGMTRENQGTLIFSWLSFTLAQACNSIVTRASGGPSRVSQRSGPVGCSPSSYFSYNVSLAVVPACPWAGLFTARFS